MGDYEVNLLTADGSTGLLSWLAENDFELPPGSDEHIEQYLEQGYMFAAVSVPPGAVVADGTALPPLNFDLSEGFRALPLLLAAVEGEDEVCHRTFFACFCACFLACVSGPCV